MSDFIGLQGAATGVVIHEEEVQPNVRLVCQHHTGNDGGVHYRVYRGEEMVYEELVNFDKRPKHNLDNMRRAANKAYDFAINVDTGAISGRQI